MEDKIKLVFSVLRGISFHDVVFQYDEPTPNMVGLASVWEPGSTQADGSYDGEGNTFDEACEALLKTIRSRGDHERSVVESCRVNRYGPYRIKLLWRRLPIQMPKMRTPAGENEARRGRRG